MPHSILRIIALIFIGLVVMQTILGGVVFAMHAGFTPSSVFEYYSNKSFHGLLEVVLPHFFFISIALGATLHFFTFIQTLDEIFKSQIVYLLFVLFFIDQSSVFLIAQGFEIFGMIKLSAFIGFELVLGWIWIVIFTHTLKEAE